MTPLTAAETLHHIHYKIACHELPEHVGTTMVGLLERDPSLDYATLRTMALRREMPDAVFHTSALRNAGSIASFGLLAADPAQNRSGLFLLGQPTGVYISAEPDEIGMWTRGEIVWGIWSVTGATALPHRQDPLNPEHFVIESDVPRGMVAFCGTASLDPRHHRLTIPS